MEPRERGRVLYIYCWEVIKFTVSFLTAKERRKPGH